MKQLIKFVKVISIYFSLSRDGGLRVLERTASRALRKELRLNHIAVPIKKANPSVTTRWWWFNTCLRHP